MSYFQRVQKAVDFIEEHLADDITLQDVSKQAYFSLYHFHRVFHCITGSSIKEYIRKRRLAKASVEITSTNARIIDIAFKYHYETPESFSRAFKNEFGCAPDHYRKNGIHGEYFKPFSIKEHTFMKGDMSMEPAIKTIESFKVVGFKLETTSIDGRNMQEIPKFWEEIMLDDFAQLKRIKDVVNGHICYGICTDLREDSSFSYIIGYEVSSFNNDQEDMCCQVIPEAKYAVFTSKGQFPESIQSTVRYAYGKWLPQSGYELARTADFEVYDENRMKNPKSAECDICIPIV